MKIEFKELQTYLIIQAQGRLDVSWADYFKDALLLKIREGHHKLVIDASQLNFISSAGIRALLTIYKEIKALEGFFKIVRPGSFVQQTLSMSGFQSWLEQDFPADLAGLGLRPDKDPDLGRDLQTYPLDSDAYFTLRAAACWHPWQAVQEKQIKTISFGLDNIALGIGCAASSVKEARDRFGEFLAINGNVVYQPPREDSPPDYLLAEKEFIPELKCIQALELKGRPSHLLRFAPAGQTFFYPFSKLLEFIFGQVKADAAGFVLLAEIEGLVGANLIRSPGMLAPEQNIDYPEIKDWLSFCGERSYAHHQALVTGLLSKNSKSLVPDLPCKPKLAVHAHAAVFPYQPVQNGNIDLQASVNKFFHATPALAVMHLAEDCRPLVGLGESAFVRGACWFSPLQNLEVLP